MAILDYISSQTAHAAKMADSQPKIWCLVTQRDDVCYSFKFKEDAKGQEVMDEVCYDLWYCISLAMLFLCTSSAHKNFHAILLQLLAKTT